METIAALEMAARLVPLSGGGNAGKKIEVSYHSINGYQDTLFGSSPSPSSEGDFESYLGQPWKEYSRAVVMESNIDVPFAAPPHPL
ncbi:hypothetical protein LINPERPRIM_LOCUS13189 [Linum perenne]